MKEYVGGGTKDSGGGGEKNLDEDSVGGGRARNGDGEEDKRDGKMLLSRGRLEDEDSGG